MITTNGLKGMHTKRAVLVQTDISLKTVLNLKSECTGVKVELGIRVLAVWHIPVGSLVADD